MRNRLINWVCRGKRFDFENAWNCTIYYRWPFRVVSHSECAADFETLHFVPTESAKYWATTDAAVNGAEEAPGIWVAFREAEQHMWDEVPF